MGEMTWPTPAPASGVTFPVGTREEALLRPEVGAGSLSLLPEPPIVSAATTGIPVAVRPSGLHADGGYLYSITFGNPWAFQVIDITTNPRQPEIVGQTPPGVSPLPYVVRGATAIGKAFACTSAGQRLRRYDVSNPAAPFEDAFVACGAQPFGFDLNADASIAVVATTSGGVGLRIVDTATMTILGSLTDGTAYADVAVEGTLAYCSAFVPGAFRVVDFSNPAAPVLRGQVTGLPSSIRRITVLNGVAYLLARDSGPQGGLMYVFDARDPDSPVLVKTLNCPNTSDESNIEVSGNTLITSRWAGGASGKQLRVWSLADPADPTLSRLIQYNGPSDFPYAIAAAGNFVYCGNRQFAPNNRIFTVELR